MIEEVQIFLTGQVVVFNSSSDRILNLAGSWAEKKEEIIAEIVAQNRHPVFKIVSVNEWANRISFEQAKTLTIGHESEKVKVKKEKDGKQSINRSNPQISSEESETKLSS